MVADNSQFTSDEMEATILTVGDPQLYRNQRRILEKLSSRLLERKDGVLSVTH
jgi:hypothetical protein